MKTRGGKGIWLKRALFVLPFCLMGCGSSMQSADDYNECVLRGIAVADSSAQAAQIKKKCQEQHPGSVLQQRSRELPPAALQKIELDADIEFDEYLNGTAYNGNADILVTELTIALQVGEAGNADTQLYTAQVNMGPLSRSDIGILLESELPAIHWKIVSARGVAR